MGKQNSPGRQNSQSRPSPHRKIRLPSEVAGPLRPFARRVHQRHWLRRACLCACAGIGAGILLLGLSFLVPIPHAMGWAAGLAAAVALAAGGAAYFVGRGPEQLAAEIDSCGFRERVQTMLALRDDDTAFAALQRADTVRALQAADPKTSVPVRPPKRLLALAAVGLAAFLLLGFVPSPQRAAVEAQEELRAVLRQQAEKVESLMDELGQATGLDDARKAALNDKLKELADQLRKGGDYKESIRQASAIQQALGQMQEELLQNELDALRDAFESQPAAEALAQALQDANTPAQVAQAIENAVLEALENGPQTAQDLAQALRDAAAKTGDEALKQALENLADALESGDADAIEEALQQLEEALENAGADADAQALSDQLQLVKNRLGQLSSDGGKNQGGNSGSGQNGNSGNGQGGNSGSGQSGSGQGGNSGSGNGQGQGGNSGSGQSGNGNGQGAGAGSGDLVESEKIYDSARLAGGGQQSLLPGDKQDGSPGQQGEVDTGTGTLEGYVPYQQVVGDYAQSAVRSAERAQLPPAVQDWVKNYFSALQNQSK